MGSISRQTQATPCDASRRGRHEDVALVWSSRAMRNGTIGCLVIMVTATGATAEFDASKPYHIKTEPARTVEALLDVRINAPAMFATEWVAVVPTAPNLPGQTGVLHEILFNGRLSNALAATENSPLARPIRAMRIAGDGRDFHTLSFVSRYRCELSRRTLEPGPPAGPVADLTPAERQFYTLPSATIDFNQPRFSAWFRTSGMQRLRGESDLALAYRVFRRLVETGKYTPGEQDRHPSVTSGTMATDCGGFAMLYVAILRANGVPARTLWGRWAKSGEGDDGQFHVKAEFFEKSIGWIPVEIANAITSGDSDKDAFFGRDDGDFIVIHADTDLRVNSIHFGMKDVGWRQGALFWAKGSGTLDGHQFTETWTVNPIGPQPGGKNK